MLVPGTAPRSGGCRCSHPLGVPAVAPWLRGGGHAAGEPARARGVGGTPHLRCARGGDRGERGPPAGGTAHAAGAGLGDAQRCGSVRGATGDAGGGVLRGTRSAVRGGVLGRSRDGGAACGAAATGRRGLGRVSRGRFGAGRAAHDADGRGACAAAARAAHAPYGDRVGRERAPKGPR
eukprot:scaffold59588_cov85-Phaeocystis_antarctica.AAC.1